MCGQPMSSGTISQQRDITQRGSAIDLFSVGHVSDRLEQPTVGIFRLDHDMVVPAPRYSFRQSNRIRSRLVMR